MSLLEQTTSMPQKYLRDSWFEGVDESMLSTL